MKLTSRSKCNHDFMVHEFRYDFTGIDMTGSVTTVKMICGKCGRRKREKHDGMITPDEYQKTLTKSKLNRLYGINAFKS